MLSAIAVIVFVYSTKIVDFPRSAFFLLVAFTTIFFCLWRIAKRLFVNFLAANGYNNFNVLIIGAGKVGLTLAEEIRRHPSFGLRVVGFLDDSKTGADLIGCYEVLGKLSDLNDVCKRRFITKIFVTVHPNGQNFHQILEVAKDLRIAVRVVPQAFDMATGDIFKYNIGFIPVLEYTNLSANRQQYGKRFFDFVLAFFSLLVLSPFFIVIAVLIKFDSPGPVFYFSRRYGKGGRVFKMWKFRSMVADADAKMDELKGKNEVDGPIFKIKQDPRVTPLGKFFEKIQL